MKRSISRRATVAVATAALLVTLPPAQPVAEAASFKVDICHIPPGNPANAHTISVGIAAVPAHLINHGDSIGACNNAPPGS